MSGIVFSGISKSYSGREVLDLPELTIPESSLTVLCGPAASGKSVLLRLLVGLETPDRGRILIGGADVTALSAAQRRVGYVPQTFALFPHMSVFENIAFPLRMQGVATAVITRRVGQAAEILRIGGLLAKSPSQLSGGEKQRVAIARGMLKDAIVFVLDDPLVGLDFKLREALMDDLKDMRVQLGATFLYATSDSLEALTMAEQLVVLDGGHVIEQGSVDAIYHQPTQLRSMELIGFPRCNVINGRITDRRCVTDLADIEFDLVSAVGTVSEAPMAVAVAVAVRPEAIVYRPEGKPAAGILGVGRITLVENLGAESVIYFETAELGLVSIPSTGQVAHLDVGDDYPFAIEPGSLAVFAASDGRYLGCGRPSAAPGVLSGRTMLENTGGE